VLGLYSCVAIAWVGALVADLVINKPLGLSPAFVEFRRAYLYDINPVGVGSTLVASAVSVAACCGLWGSTARAFSPFIALVTAMALAPAIAWATGGKYYIARPRPAEGEVSRTCCICGNDFEPEDMAQCPAYAGSICSLCCTLDARCGDMCKKSLSPDGADSRRRRWIPWTKGLSEQVYARLHGFFSTFAILCIAVTTLVWMLYYQQSLAPRDTPMGTVFFKMWAILLVVIGVASWWLALTKESRSVAEEESARQTILLQQEIEEHRKTDAALQKAKEAAEHASQAKSRFLASMSHELRTPLNSIIGYSQILEKDDSVPPNRKNAVETIRESGEHVLALVDEILDIARIEAGRFRLRPVATDFAEFLTQIVNMFRIAADRKGLAFRLQIPDALPRVVRMDQQRVRQILLNLIGNAVKFTSSGEVIVYIRYSGDIARIHVVDTGLGIPAEDIERIFHPFQRAQNTPHTDDSTGLGLTISRMITEKMGGELTVDSELGRGSTFQLRLFLPELRGTQLASGLREVAGYRGTKRRLLLVDDQPDQRAVVRNMLEPLGFSVFEAADARECMRVVQELRVDAVFLDLVMPGMSGLTLCRRLRDELQWRGTVIAVSANVFESDREKAAGAGCDGFVGKPVRLAVLLEQLQLHLALEWMYGTDVMVNPEAPPADIAEYPAIPPPERLLAMREHARIGYVKGISEEIERLCTLDPLYHRYAARLRELARQFNTAEIIAFIEETLSRECNTSQA
jgi:signal transduction histidine kinase/DNA-binding NarL/FixJ family response regulator